MQTVANMNQEHYRQYPDQLVRRVRPHRLRPGWQADPETEAG